MFNIQHARADSPSGSSGHRLWATKLDFLLHPTRDCDSATRWYRPTTNLVNTTFIKRDYF